MLDVDLARRLLSAGLLWEPVAGDRFVVPDGELRDEVFYVSDMTIEVHEYTSGRVLGFNGTTEWALDSLDLTDVLWMPREDQLREALGERLRTVTRLPDGWRVETSLGRYEAADVEDAYASALLAALAETTPEPGRGY